MPDGAEEVAIDHQAEADHQSRHHAGHEQPGDRDVADRAIDHGGDARRHQRRDGGGGRDDRGDEGGLVAFPLHRAAQRAAHDRDVGGGRSRHFREEHAEDDDDLRQPAPDMPDQRQRQIGYSHHDIRRTHEFADQQEERDRQQRLGIDAVKDLLDDRRQRNIGQHARRRTRPPAAKTARARRDSRRTGSRTSSSRG